MKVLHIVAGDLRGGAARGAYWLHQGLEKLGIESKILTNSYTTLDDENVITTVVNKKSKIINAIRTRLNSWPDWLYRGRQRKIFSTGFVGFNFTKLKEYKEADIIHLHWINGGFVDIKDLSRITKPMVWTARDMWSFTGGCHCAMKCERYMQGCGQCKQLGSNREYDLSRFIINRKKKYIPNTLKVVGISNWLAEQAKKSYLFKDFDIRMISNNINTNEFFGIKKDVARNILGIHTNKKIILTSAPGLREHHKGFDLYLDALSRLDKNKYFLCFFGRLNNTIPDSLGFEYKSFGFLYENVSLRLLYSSADVFVAPTVMDSFGKTIAEAMSCCTPAVCFDATGPKDIVDHKVNGYLAKPFESSDMAEGIKWILDSDDSLGMGERAREKIKKHFDSEIVAGKYVELYNEILG